MRNYPRFHALDRFALLPPEYLKSKWYAPAANVFMTPILSPIMKYLDANNIDIELPFLTRNAEYAPNADDLSKPTFSYNTEEIQLATFMQLYSLPLKQHGIMSITISKKLMS